MQILASILRKTALGLALGLAALAPFSAGTASAAPLRIGISADITSIDPHYVNITPTNNIAFHIFETLVAVDDDARLMSGLAISWKAVDPLTLDQGRSGTRNNRLRHVRARPLVPRSSYSGDRVRFKWGCSSREGKKR